jgi:acetolactate synthase-1/3 small subunit
MPQTQSSHSLGDLPTQGGEQTPAQAAHEETEASHAHEEAERAQQAQFEQQRNLLSHSEALIRQGQHLAAIQSLSAQFGGRTVDISAATVTIELTGKSERIDAFLSLVRPYGMLEAARSGTSSSC